MPSKPVSSATVSCRRPRGEWVGVVLFASFGTLCTYLFQVLPHTPGRSDLFTFCFTVLPLFAIAGYFAARQMRSYIVADVRGIRWRRLGRELEVTWSEVHDYYLTELNGRTYGAIETARGEIHLLNWTNSDALQQIVAESAHNACSNSWKLKSVRDLDDGPRTFRYDTPENRWMSPLLFACILGLPLCMILDPKSQAALVSVWNKNGPGAVLASLVMPLAAGLLMTVMFMPHFTVWREGRRRWDERLVATPNELTWRKGAASRTVRWNDITNLYLRRTGLIKVPSIFVVETAHEKLEWAASLNNCHELAALTKRLAKNAPILGWTVPEIRHSGAPGDIVFNYCRFPNLILLLLLSFMDLFTAWSVILHDINSGLSIGEIFFYGSIGLLLLLSWWRYFSARVVVAPDGVRHYTAFGIRFLLWSKIEAAEKITGVCFVSIRIRGREHSLWVLERIDGRDELLALVNQRIKEFEGKTDSSASNPSV